MIHGFKPTVLIIDDTPHLPQQLQQHLEKHDFTVTLTPTTVLRHLQTHMVLLINAHPENNPSPLNVLHTLKTKHPPIKILLYSTIANSKDRIQGLQAGADDYINWPCDPQELTTRIQVLTRNLLPHTHHLGPLTLHLNTHQAEFFGETIPLTRQECQLLYRLTLTPDVAVPRETLMQSITEFTDESNNRLIDVLVFSIRKKLHKKLILAIRGLGYALNTHFFSNPDLSKRTRQT